jgi:colicin import membrane protein
MKRQSIIVALAILAAGVPAVLWLSGFADRPAESAQMATVLQAERERQRRSVMEEVALRQKQLDERNLADAHRIAEQDRQRREAAIMQALHKQQQQEQDRKLAEAERQLELDRAHHAGIVQASQRQWQLDERKRADAQRLAEAAHQQRMEATARKQTEDGRLAEAERQLELERVRQAMVVQASMQQHRAEDSNLAEARPAAAATQKRRHETKQAAAPAQSSPLVDGAARSKSKPARRSVRRPPARAVAARRGASPYAAFDAMVARVLTDLCPLRWLDRVLVELSTPRRLG